MYLKCVRREPESAKYSNKLFNQGIYLLLWQLHYITIYEKQKN